MLEWEHEEVKTEKITSKSESGKIKAEKPLTFWKWKWEGKSWTTADIQKVKVGRSKLKKPLTLKKW